MKSRDIKLPFRRVAIAGLLFLAANALTGPSEANQPDEAPLAQIKTAIIRSLCYDVYWGGGEFYRRGVPLPLKVKLEGAKFYAKVENVEHWRKQKQWVSFYHIGLVKADRAVVTHNFELEMDKRFTSGSVMNDTLTIPKDCTPRYDPPTPQKERMLRTVVSTMQTQLSWLVREGIANYPKDVTLIIADFNVDYPETYILVEPPGKLYAVTLHDPQHYESDKYEREGQYPFGEIRVKPHHKPLLAKIRKHGIIRKIVLTP